MGKEVKCPRNEIFFLVSMDIKQLFASELEKIPCREQFMRYGSAKAVRNLLSFYVC